MTLAHNLYRFGTFSNYVDILISLIIQGFFVFKVTNKHAMGRDRLHALPKDYNATGAIYTELIQKKDRAFL